MKLSALVTSLILGASSVALASPATDGPAVSYHHDGPATGKPIVRDHRLPFRPGIERPTFERPTFERPGFAQSWTTLASSKRLQWGQSAVQLYTPMRARMLKLEANRGMSFIDRVEITFANGRTQIVELDRRLGMHNPVLIDLEGRNRMITRVAVFGRGGWMSSYKLLAA